MQSLATVRSIKKAKILIVEDEAIVVEHIEVTLKSFGYEIAGRTNTGEEAIQIAQKNSPDLILMDIRLRGELDGIEAAKQITTLSDIPVVFLTAFADDQLVERARTVLPYGYIVKPIQKGTLKATIEMALYMAKIAGERQFIEKELRERERWLNSTFQQAAVGIAHVDLEGRFLRVNQHYCEIMGYEQDELVGIGLEDISHPKFLDEEFEHFNKLIENRMDSFTQEKINIRKDQSEVWVRLSASCVKDQDGKIDFIIVIIEDITRRKNLEKMLQQTQKMEAIGTLAGGIAHDFNNILHPVIGFSKLGIRATEEDEKTHSYFKVIYDATNRAKHLVKQILTFSRQNEPILQPVLLTPVVKETVKMLRSSLPTTINLLGEISDQTDPIKADVTQVHQIIMNLGTNAFHAVEDKGGDIKIVFQPLEVEIETDAYPDLKPGHYYRLSVIDNGHGIPDNIKHKIFDPYFTTKGQNKGTGLGLSVVKGIVDSHNGKLIVKSSPETGTEFNVLFPLSEEQIPQKKKKAVAIEIKGNERIMVVDDEENIVFLLSESLKSMGYKVSAKTASRDAFDEFKTNPANIDLVITDMTMPYKTGFELARDLLEIRPDLPVILCTGYNERISEEKAISIGIRKFLNKPIDQDVLASVIREELDRCR